MSPSSHLYWHYTDFESRKLLLCGIYVGLNFCDNIIFRFHYIQWDAELWYIIENECDFCFQMDIGILFVSMPYEVINPKLCCLEKAVVPI